MKHAWLACLGLFCLSLGFCGLLAEARARSAESPDVAFIGDVVYENHYCNELSCDPIYCRALNEDNLACKYARHYSGRRDYRCLETTNAKCTKKDLQPCLDEYTCTKSPAQDECIPTDQWPEPWKCAHPHDQCTGPAVNRRHNNCLTESNT